MNCTYCGTQNLDTDHRCRRCGRRLHYETMQMAPAGAVPHLRTAAAPKLDQRQRIPAEVTAAMKKEAPALPPRQKSLFPEPVLRFEDFAPRPAKATAGQVPRRPRRARVSRRLKKLEEAGQQRLDFTVAAQPARRSLKSGVRSARSSRLPVAMPHERLAAAALDGALIVAALALLGLTVAAVGGAGVVASAPPFVYGVAAAAVLTLYSALWWLAGGETPGMAWRHLRLLTFTDQRPTRAQRAQRSLWALLSLAAAGLGVLWMVADEDHLGWHDYLSRTFPTPVRPKR